jgi:hypothetical protein
MMLVGFAWFLKALKAADSLLLFMRGYPLGSLYAAAFIQPAAELSERATRQPATANRRRERTIAHKPIFAARRCAER